MRFLPNGSQKTLVFGV